MVNESNYGTRQDDVFLILFTWKRKWNEEDECHVSEPRPENQQTVNSNNCRREIMWHEHFESACDSSHVHDVDGQHMNHCLDRFFTVHVSVKRERQAVPVKPHTI
jgi:hypothetical protein